MRLNICAPIFKQSIAVPLVILTYTKRHKFNIAAAGLSLCNDAGT
jgi:hypothetical protein